MTGVEMLTAPNISPEQSLPAVQILTDVARAAEVRQQMSAQVEVVAREIGEQLQQQLEDVMDGLNVIARSYNKKLRFHGFLLCRITAASTRPGRFRHHPHRPPTARQTHGSETRGAAMASTPLSAN